MQDNNNPWHDERLFSWLHRKLRWRVFLRRYNTLNQMRLALKWQGVVIEMESRAW